MALKTGEDYKRSLEKMKTVVYVRGEKVDEFYDHPCLKPAVETVAVGYDLAHNPHHTSCTVAVSQLTREIVNRFVHVATSAEELIKREQQIRLASFITGECLYQCTGTDAIHAAACTTYDVDVALGTNYYQRFNEWLKYIQMNDLCVNGVITDVKGDRSKRPTEQINPDLFLRVVEKRKDGILVRGAKVHQSGAAVMHEHLVYPCQAMRKREEQYAVLFAIPADAEGIIHIHQGSAADAMRMVGDDMDFGNIKYGASSTQMTIFNNVVVPWDRVFMCGETQFTRDLVERFGRVHRCVSCSCTSGWIDDFIGVAQTLSEYNGVADVPHIKDKIAQMTFLGGRAFACGIAAAALGCKTPSGVYLPDRLLSNIGKLDGALSINESRQLGIDIAGGLMATAPWGKDYQHPEVGKYIEEFLQGVEGVPTEHRFRMFKLAHHLYTSSGIVETKIQGSGPSQVQKVNIYHLANLALKTKVARILCGIEAEEEMGNVLRDFPGIT
ncbi:4-hydroxyphenylacetate 3-hydroxylase N-terminal domain-containing protein [Chloroflexota bacterium]